MRIVAGAFKGRRLATPPGRQIRPTSDKLRETLFNVLAFDVPGARVLDGFAGTGAIGLEAISRGAAHVTFVERSREAVSLIESNLARCRVSDGYTMLRSDMRVAAAELPAGGFDLVFLDPPYAEPDVASVLEQVAPLVADDGRLVLEHARRVASPDQAGPLARERQIASGDSALSFYRAGSASASTRSRATWSDESELPSTRARSIR